MVTKTKISIGILMLILISSSIVYVEWSNNAKIRVDESQSSFYVPHDTMSWIWVVAGREYNKLYDGSSLMNRDLKGIKIATTYDQDTITIKRTTPFKRGPVIIDTYVFNGKIDDIELFPISHTVEVFNATGSYYRYEVKDLTYDGSTFKLDGEQTSQSFGKNMKVSWWKDYRLGWIYKSGSMYVKSERLESDYEKFEVRLFDPEITTGCTEDSVAHVLSCTGAFTGNYLDYNNSSLYIHDATIDATAGDFLRLNSTYGWINITDTIINTYGAAGTDFVGPGCNNARFYAGTGGQPYFYLYANETQEIIFDNVTINNYGGAGGSGTTCATSSGLPHGANGGYGGDAEIVFYRGNKSVIINSTIYNYGGAGGTGGATTSADSSTSGESGEGGIGGSGNFTSFIPLEINDTEIYYYGGNSADGGACSCSTSDDTTCYEGGRSAGGESKFYIKNFTTFEFHNVSLIGYSGTYGNQGAYGGGCATDGGYYRDSPDNGNVYFDFIADIFKLYDGIIINTSVGAGTANVQSGRSTTYFESSKDIFFDNYSIDGTQFATNYPIINLSNDTNPGLGVFNGTKFFQTTYVYCESGTTLKLGNDSDLDATSNLDFTSCPPYNEKNLDNVTYEDFFPVVDSTSPNVTIEYPINNTNFTTTDVDINYTATDTGLESCWYTNDSGVVNTTVTCNANLTTQIWDEGTNTVTIYANDTLSNLGQDSITFRVDTINPSIIIVSPTNTTYNVFSATSIDFNVSSDEDLETCIVSLDSFVTNISMSQTNSSYFSFTNSSMSFGGYTASFWCNDTVGYVNNTESVGFTIADASAGYSINIYLDGVNDTRKYEYNTTANITANIIGCTSNCNICLDIDDSINNISYSFGDKNYTCDNGSVTALYTIAPLRENAFNDSTIAKNFSSGESGFISLDNRTDIDSFTFNITNSGAASENITIDVNQDDIVDVNLLGKLEVQKLLMPWFYSESSKKNVLNLTRNTAGTKTIYMNISTAGFKTDGNVENFSFQLDGFNVDELNGFNFTDNFSDRSTFNGDYNENMSLFSDIDDFYDNDSSDWYVASGIPTEMSIVNPFITNSYLSMISSGSDGNTNLFVGNMTAFNLSSTYQFDTYLTDSCSWGLVKVGGQHEYLKLYSRMYFTDGTTTVQIYSSQCGGGDTAGDGSSASGSNTHILNISGIRTADTSWDIYEGGVFKSTISTISLDPDLVTKMEFGLVAAQSGGGSGSWNQAFQLYNLSQSGISLNMVNSSYSNVTPYNYTSVSLNVTPTNIQRALLDVNVYVPDNATINYYLSNDNQTTWESVTPGINHPFSSSGKNISTRFELNTNNVSISPIVYDYSVSIVPSATTDILVDVGAEGTTEWNFSGILNTTTSPQHFRYNGTATYDYIQDNCPTDSSCYVPIAITFGTPGTIQISNFNLTHNPNPINIASSTVESIDPINLTFDLTGGEVEVSDIKLDFLGSKNITIFSHFSQSVGVNYSQVLQVRYSKFNISLPDDIDYWEVFPSTKDSKNVTPYSQTDLINIWNITSQAYDEPMDIYLKTNESLNQCLDIWFSNNGTEKEYDDSLVVYLAFSRGEKLLDRSKNNFEITDADATWTENGKIGGAYTFDGTQEINISSNPLLNIRKNITMMIRFKTPVSGTQRIFSKQGVYGMGMGSSGTVGFTWYYAGGWHGVGDPTVLTPNTWYHIAATYDGQFLKFYTNGILKDEDEDNSSLGINGLPLIVGSYNGNQKFTGTLDEAMLFDRTLSPSEILSEASRTKDSFRLNLNTTSYQVANNLSVEDSTGQWNWIDLTNCTNRFEMPWFYWSSICSECVKTTEYDETNLIET